MAVRLAWMPLGLLAACTTAAAMPPPDDSNFNPSSLTYSGPTTIRFSGFCLKLNAGETAEKSQYEMWANHTVAKLTSGTLDIEQNGSGGYGPDPGRKIRKVNGGWLVRNKEDGQTIYYFDNGMTGTTSISYRSNKGSQRLEPLLKRFVFSGSCGW